MNFSTTDVPLPARPPKSSPANLHRDEAGDPVDLKRRTPSARRRAANWSRSAIILSPTLVEPIGMEPKSESQRATSSCIQRSSGGASETPSLGGSVVVGN